MNLEKDPTVYENPTQALQDHGMMLLMAEVSHETIKPIIEWILHENHVRKTPAKELLLMICSEGGDLASAFALIDVVRSSRIPVKTVGLGNIASAGLMIFIAGEPGRRVLTPNTSILSHQFTHETVGKEHELFAIIKEYQLTQERMIKHYSLCTNLTEDKIKEILLPPHDVYLNATEALELGLCDIVAEIPRRRGQK